MTARFLGLAALALLACASLSVTAAPEPKERVFELRTYTANPGKAEAMHKRFREHTCSLFKKHGMELVGFWVPQDKKDVLVYMLAFPSRDAAKASWKAFSSDPEWQKVYKESHKDGVLVGKVESVYMDPTDYSDIK
ncbi:MAG: NIPSNAP family protein [Isosphaeraceae bacterium]|nr:NIPSNAP family protein [Isosphaeraceae bacterium]